MRSLYRVLPSVAALLALLALGPVATAQDDSESKPLTVGAFNIQGSVTAGYRFDDIKGYQPQYREMFDLGKGFRLMDFNVYGESERRHESVRR